MIEPTSIKDLIGLWPSRRELADDIGVDMARVHKWAQTGSIPARFHLDVLRSAASREISITADMIVRLHAIPMRGDAA